MIVMDGTLTSCIPTPEYSDIKKIGRCGIIANETFTLSSNEVDVSSYRQPYGFYNEKSIHTI